MLQAFKLPQRFRFKDINLRPGRTYIFPTGFGFLFAILAVIQLIMAIASQNNLIYLFVFAEVSVALASMFFTNHNIWKTTVSAVSAETCFAREEDWITLHIETRENKPVFHLKVRWSFEKTPVLVPPSSSQTILPWSPSRRGMQKVPRLNLESSFPFGLLRAWKIISLEQEILVYPSRHGKSAFPASSIGDRNLEQHGLFYDLRTFQRGDWPRRIDWRASQRSQKLLIRRFEEEATVQMKFQWQQVSHIPDFENKVSQLALWVDLAERQGSEYTLVLGSWNSGKGRGPTHWTVCMEKLALLQESQFL